MPPVTASGYITTVSASYGDDGVASGDDCHAMGEACERKRCCSATAGSCFRTYANAGVESYSCQRSCTEPGTRRPCKVLAPCAQPWRDCSTSGCCVSDTQRCFEKNRTFASCMPECLPTLPRFRGWSCADRDGRSNEQQAALRGYGSIEIKAAVRDNVDVARSFMRNILGEELTLLGEQQLGKTFFTLFLTLASGFACCSLYVAGRLVCSACRETRSEASRRRLKQELRARARGRPMRLASVDEEDDEILGDE